MQKEEKQYGNSNSHHWYQDESGVLYQKFDATRNNSAPEDSLYVNDKKSALKRHR
jgi:hypothetical protein